MSPSASRPEHAPRDPAPPPPAEPAAEGPVCEICGAVMFERHCKVLCPRCGHQRDCSDP